MRLDIYEPPRFFGAFLTPAVAATIGTLAANVLHHLGSLRSQPA